MKIYFSGSIRGGRDDAKIYNQIIAYLKNFTISDGQPLLRSGWTKQNS